MDTVMLSDRQPLSSSGSATVLVVEDEIFVREPIAEYLRDCGYHVLEAGDAREAISLVEGATSVDVVFSDVRMPGDMDGFALAQWLRSHHPEVSVLLTSGYYATRQLGAPAPDVKLIEKPYSQAHVLRRIRALLEDPPQN
ncbi:MAG: response regulator [Rhodospirillales bacterium]|jgi:CheY-like chemotaxis protein|nr:response regulator [Rhodospirillales bacterium]MBN8925394.1 response regulator [Rhodospirillales bacterium]